LQIKGYEIRGEVSRTPGYVLNRARRLGDDRAVLLKAPVSDPPSAADVQSFENEFAVLRELAVTGVPAAFELVREGRRRVLVFEDEGALPLALLPSWRRPSIPSLLSLASELSGILAELHRREIVHRNVNPWSIHIRPSDGRVFLTDFGLASSAAEAEGGTVAPHRIRGTLAYLSPEQTGRMNRVTDYRTDFYSFGMTLYELLTGSLPLQSNDVLEWIHWHIAVAPASPREVEPTVPDALSRIVSKLLSKIVEERYQSASGLKADLELVARAFAEGRPLPEFRPGEREVRDRFVIPKTLYGRDRELQLLLDVFDQTCAGDSALMLVAGYSGIGKTALIQELYKPLVRRRGYFAGGKFDQVVRDLPFGALIQAFRGLLQQLLAEPDERLAYWRERIARAVATGAGVLADVIPEIELLLGEQPDSPPLGPSETLNRFQLAFQNFLGALAQREHPLVVFLDDLQWADSATLSLLQPLLASPDVRYLLVIGAYRDNEVDAGHPLARSVASLESAGVRVARIFLGPLEAPDLSLLLRDVLHRELADVGPLARLVQEKTAGNPFFTIEFLKLLRQEGLVSFDYELGHWSFRLEAIPGAAITDNVIDLMTRKIQRLSENTQRRLMLAACIGGNFDLSTLATVSESSISAAADDLKEALDEGLLVSTAGGGVSATARESESGVAPAAYAFLHDRVQQAAYSLIPEDRRARVHASVGHLLLERWDRSQAPEKIFDIVGHLNVGSAAIVDPGDRLALARLDLEAGRRAKASTAYDAGSGYLDHGIAVSSEPWWRTDYPLMFDLYLAAAECHYLGRRFDVAEGYFGLILSRARTAFDGARVHALRMVLYENLSHYRRAVASGREGLMLLGIELPERPEDVRLALDAEIDAIHRRLGDRAIASLIDLPASTDENVLLLMSILVSLWSPAYISGDDRVARLISATIVRLSLTHGNCGDSAYGYVTHAITIGPIRGDYRSAYEWGELALSVNERFDDLKCRAKIHQQFHAHVKLWRQPFESCIPHAREARRSGLEAGDLNYAGYGAVTETWPAFPIANDLARFVRDYEPAAKLLERLHLSDFLSALRVMLNWALALQGRTAGPLSLSSASFDEGAFLAKFESEPFFRTFFYTAKLHLAVVMEEAELGLRAARRARQGTLLGTLWPVLVDFWGGLASTAGFADASEEERAAYRSQLAASEASLRVLAENCPENFRCYWLLLSAEIQRVSGEPSDAEQSCKAAIAYARRTDNLQMEALANELCAKATMAHSGPSAGVPFLLEARRCYAAWGAVTKVQQMEAKYGTLLSPAPAPPTAPGTVAPSRPGALETGVDGRDSALDIATILEGAQTIAVEMELDELLRKLMRISLLSAGAQRGFFLRDRRGRMVVEIEGTATGGSHRTTRALEDVTDVATSVVQYVRTTRQSVVLGDAAADERFIEDRYIATVHPRSILCVPAVQQGKLEGILYLENNLAPDAFTADRIQVLEVLSSQAAISLENARLYQEMREEAAERRRAEEMLLQVTEGTASTLGRDFFASLVEHLASAVDVRYAFLAECPDPTIPRARSLAFWNIDRLGDNFEYDISETPCKKVVDGELCHYGDDLQKLFPNDLGLVRWGARSYLGVPMYDASGRVIGHLAVLDDEPMVEDARTASILKIFSSRAGAELERLHAEEDLRAALAEVEGLKNRLQAENVYLQEELSQEHNFQEMVGTSPALVELLRRVERVAPTDATVLVYGETGTGKELIARAIHSRSGRKERALVKVNCGAISAGLVESELFGHVKGAFTGAIDRRVGRFELADGGTLFLDEVAELPLETQVKLLRVLQEQEFEPLGSSRSVRVSVRIIAATNRDLEEAVAAGRFRSDLFFRLNVLPLEVPPLRERRSDVPQLVTFFMTRFAKQFGKRMEAVDRATMELLVAYDWPGNVRELQNVVERAVVLSQGPVLQLDRDLVPAGESTRARPVPAPEPDPDAGAIPVSRSESARVQPASPATLEELERAHILAVLERTGGVIEGPSGAAKILALHPNTLRSRMKKLGLQRRPKAS
jgi:predicted ATPase/transcriptional regulator with GAF, ATPase, and Fis domain